MKVYTFSEARQQFSAVLDSAQREGGVQVTRRDGRVFIIQPAAVSTSPLAISGVNLKLKKGELLGFIHESRRA